MEGNVVAGNVSYNSFRYASMDTSRPPYRYGLSLIVSLVAFVLTRCTMPFFQHNAFDFYMGAVVSSAYFGGVRPALLTAILAVPTISYFFLPPYNAFSVSSTDLLRLAVFASVALLVSSLSGRLKEATSGLRQVLDELETRVLQRTRELTRVNTELQAEIAQRLEVEKEILQVSHQEQLRLGEDLHDGLCQTLVGLRYLTQDLRDQATASGQTWATDVARIDQRLDEALSQADVVARGLYPVDLESNGLYATVRELAEKTSLIYRVTCRVRQLGEPLDRGLFVDNHLFRIAREALMNAIKHGKCRRISIRLKQSPKQFSLTVFDDGVGLKQPSQRSGTGMGLKIMQYRARILNAQFKICSRARGFTRVSVVIKEGVSHGT